MKNFKQLKTTRKGEYGEEIVQELLIGWGFTIYPAPEEAHPVDFLTWKEGELTAIDVKTYPRYFSSESTGIDRADYRTYKNLSTAYRLPVKLFFVDQFEGAVYGHRLSYLEPFKQHRDGKVCFPLSAMQYVRPLTDEEVNRLTELSSVNYSQYEQMPRYFTNDTR
ncbi:MAG: hypothetical protein AAFO03_00820 [Bacteroidota bacterium]